MIDANGMDRGSRIGISAVVDRTIRGIADAQALATALTLSTLAALALAALALASAVAGTLAGLGTALAFPVSGTRACAGAVFHIPCSRLKALGTFTTGAIAATAGLQGSGQQRGCSGSQCDSNDIGDDFLFHNTG